MSFNRAILAILSIIVVSCLFAGCGGGSEGPNAGIPEWRVTLAKALVTRGGPDTDSPKFADLNIVDGVYQANAGDHIVPYISPSAITRGGPNQVYTLMNMQTGEKSEYSETMEDAAMVEWVLEPGKYRVDAVVNRDEPAVPAFLVVR